MEEGSWHKVVFNDKLCKSKKKLGRNKITNGLINGYWLECVSRNSKEIKAFVMEKFHKRTWDKELGRKKNSYIEVFNLTHNDQPKAYIEANISWRAKILIAQLRTNSHQLIPRSSKERKFTILKCLIPLIVINQKHT